MADTLKMQYSLDKISLKFIISPQEFLSDSVEKVLKQHLDL